jgi:predicted Zn-dependent protease
MPTIEGFEAMLAAGRDNALLRYSLGNEYLKLADPARAAAHLQRAVEHDPKYSAAWKLLGRALADTGELAAARAAYESGIAVAEARGDKQAAKEMAVFARRIDKQLAAPDASVSDTSEPDTSAPATD